MLVGSLAADTQAAPQLFAKLVCKPVVLSLESSRMHDYKPQINARPIFSERCKTTGWPCTLATTCVAGTGQASPLFEQAGKLQIVKS